MRCRIGERASYGFYGGCVRRFTSDDYEGRPARRAKRLTPRPGRKKSRLTRPRIGADEENIRIPARAAMLECVVEDHDIHALGDRLSDPAHAIGGRNDRNSLVQSFVDENLIAAITAQNNRGNRAHFGESPREPRSDGRLSRPSH
jgi:hypothetical protein